MRGREVLVHHTYDAPLTNGSLPKLDYATSKAGVGAAVSLKSQAPLRKLKQRCMSLLGNVKGAVETLRSAEQDLDGADATPYASADSGVDQPPDAFPDVSSPPHTVPDVTPYASADASAANYLNSVNDATPYSSADAGADLDQGRGVLRTRCWCV